MQRSELTSGVPQISSSTAPNATLPSRQFLLNTVALALTTLIIAVLWQIQTFILLGSIIAFRWMGFVWLVRYRPFTAIVLVGFIRGLVEDRWPVSDHTDFALI